MKLGVNTWVWTAPLTTEEVKRLIPHVAEIGFDWIEFPLEEIGGFDYREAAAMVKDYGLGVSSCVAMGPDRDLIHEDPAIRANGMGYIRDCIDTNEVLGATNLVGPIYATVGRTWQATPEERASFTDLLVENLSQLAQYAGDHGVKMGIEPLNRFETSVINLADQVLEVVNRVDHPSCQIMLDTFHMNIEEKSLGDAIRAAGPHLIHLHACENDRGAPGSGNVTWDEVAGALKDIGYDGPVVIESFTAKVKSIARAAAIWRPLADSQDDLAKDGLAFLQGLLT
jgi:D-psicose/D-tagatose/L-ribulose 3-epimerase